MKKDLRKISISGLKEINKLERFIEEICDYYNINNEYFGNILLATTESTNILLSLNANPSKGKVLIGFERSPKGLVFRIKLNNPELNSEKTEDFLDTEIRKHKLSKEIFIIKALTDEITISVDGKSIILIFYVSSINYEKSLQRISKLQEYFNKKVSVKQSKND